MSHTLDVLLEIFRNALKKQRIFAEKIRKDENKNKSHELILDEAMKPIRLLISDAITKEKNRISTKESSNHE